MADAGDIVVLEGGDVGVLEGGEVAVFDAQGECSECCGGGGGGPVGECGCFPLVYADGSRCGAPTVASGLSWSVRIVGEVTYSERVENITQGFLRSDVRRQTRAFDVVTLASGGICQREATAPENLQQPITFVQSVPPGVGVLPAPTLRVVVPTGNFSAADRAGWSVPTPERSTFGNVGPYAYLSPQVPSIAMIALSRVVGLRLFGWANVRDNVAAVWHGDLGGPGEAFAQGFVEETRSVQELAGNYYVAFTDGGVSGTLARRREACRYVLERGFSVAYSGRFGASEITDVQIGFAAAWRVEMAMVRCVEQVVDPRVLRASGLGPYACAGCGQ